MDKKRIEKIHIQKDRARHNEAIRIEGDNKSAQWTNNIRGILIVKERIP